MSYYMIWQGSYINNAGDVVDSLSDWCVFEDLGDAISVAKEFTGRGVMEGDQAIIYTFDEADKEVTRIDLHPLPTNWIINKSVDGCWSKEVINTEDEAEAKAKWEEVKRTAEFYYPEDREYDKHTQLHYNVTEWDFSKENDDDYEGIENTIVLRIYEDEYEYLYHACDEDKEQFRKDYWEFVERLKEETFADYVVFGNN